MGDTSRRSQPIAPLQIGFLVLDVARYRYPPIWVRTAELFAAMNAPNFDNGDRTRVKLLLIPRARIRGTLQLSLEVRATSAYRWHL